MPMSRPMAPTPDLPGPRIMLRDLAEERRARVVRLRSFLGLIAAIGLGLGYAAWLAGRHFLASSWLAADRIQADWQVDGENWRRGGATAVFAQSRRGGFLSSDKTGAGELKWLDELHRVEKLDLSNLDDLADSDIEWIDRLTDLRVLILDRVQDEGFRRPGPRGITDATLARLRGLRQLRELSIVGSRVTDAGVAPIGALPELESLDISNTGITDAGLVALRGLGRLRTLTLLGTGVTPRGIRDFQAARPGVVLYSDPATPAPR